MNTSITCLPERSDSVVLMRKVHELCGFDVHAPATAARAWEQLEEILGRFWYPVWVRGSGRIL